MSEDTPDNPADRDLIGSILDGRYELQSILGRGAGACVYKAKHRFTEQLIAIKIEKAKAAHNEAGIQRFQQEASLLSRLKHENIVQFLAFASTSDRRQYIVMELLEGETLAALIKREGALSLERALPVFKGICAGLSYIHEAGIIHRDLKPSNIMLSSEKGVKILDFGIFRDLKQNESQALTQSGVILGSAAYMSPEQCRGGKVDARSDIYSFACLIYETLVGKAPFAAENQLLTMDMQIHQEIKDIPTRFPLDKKLKQMLLLCLEKNPDKRYSSCAEIASILRTIDPHASKRAQDIRIKTIAASIAICIPATAFLVHNGRNSKKPEAPKINKSAVPSRSERPDENQDIAVFENWINSYYKNSLCKTEDLIDAWQIAERKRKVLRRKEAIPHGSEIEERLKDEIKSKSANNEAASIKETYALCDFQISRANLKGAKETLAEFEKTKTASAPDQMILTNWYRANIDALNGNFSDFQKQMDKCLNLAIKHERTFETAKLFIKMAKPLNAGSKEHSYATKLAAKCLKKSLDFNSEYPHKEVLHLCRELFHIKDYKGILELLSGQSNIFFNDENPESVFTSVYYCKAFSENARTYDPKFDSNLRRTQKRIIDAGSFL
ncbi:MAG: serine/threonine protein kinase [Candidatus Obscuribacterales bacterium]|nr:serine/threonine protein kinase [Candidatus Obscuribacterales bacterium]